MSPGVGVELARRGGDHQRLELVGRIDGRIADQEGDARGIGAVVLRHHLAVARDDAHAADVEAHHLGHRLHQDGGRALADVGGAGQHHDGAVEIEFQLHGGVRLAGPVHGLGGARDVVRAGKAEALLLARPGRGELALARLPAALFFHPVDALGQAVAVHHQVVVGEGRRVEIVGAPHGQRIEPHLALPSGRAGSRRRSARRPCRGRGRRRTAACW